MNRVRGGIVAVVLATSAFLAAPLTAHAAGADHGRVGVLAWSRFDDLESATARLVVSDEKGQHVVAITHPGPGEEDIDPRFSPDGRQILFERDTATTSLAGIIDTDGRNERIIDLGCTDPCAGTNTPTWMPDGHHLLYDRVSGPFDDTGSAASANLWKSDLYGHHQRQFSDPSLDPKTEETNASFAPGGYVIVIHGRADGHSAVFRLNLDGTHAHQLTPWLLDADLPDVSPATRGPSRNLVTFEAIGPGANEGQRVAAVPATCGSISDCTSKIIFLGSHVEIPTESFNPTWSPDGSRIAFVRYVSSQGLGTPTADIWTMRWNGTNDKPLSTDSRFEIRPAWTAVCLTSVRDRFLLV